MSRVLPPAPSSQRRKRFRQRILEWFQANGRSFPWRSEGASNYELIVVEVLLQRTRAETVASRLPAFMEKFPSWQAIRDARPEMLEDLLRPLGLWRRRAASIRKLATMLSERGGLEAQNPETLELLPGVGQYIANAIKLFVFGLPSPLLDVNMARVLERYFGPRTRADIRYDPWLQQLAHDIVDDDASIQLNWAILDLGAKVCTPRNPKCSSCPLMRVCAYGRKR